MLTSEAVTRIISDLKLQMTVMESHEDWPEWRNMELTEQIFEYLKALNSVNVAAMSDALSFMSTCTCQPNHPLSFKRKGVEL